MADLIYSRASNRISKWVLAVPEDSSIKTVKDLKVKQSQPNLLKLREVFLTIMQSRLKLSFHGVQQR